LRRTVFRKLAAYPRLFSCLLAMHVGAFRRPELATGAHLSGLRRWT
jgi:hypothetical protein